jgi:DNA-binding NtrC family response regulator
MHQSDIIILDLDPNSCPLDNCGQIANSLRKFLPEIDIALQVEHDNQAEMTIPFSARLILLKSASAKKLHKAIQNLKRLRHKGSVLAIFCASMNTQAAELRAVLNEFEDFLCCPFKEIELLLRVQLLLSGKRIISMGSPHMQSKSLFRFEGMVGESESFLRVIEKIPSVARCDATVLIAGETGTGKEIFARAIHYQSSRQAKPFIPVNCGALPDHLIENELFGHVQGAYTGASSPENGLLAEAQGGTLFLDEVNTLSTSAQVKLLRFLQDREYKPLGSPKSRTADVRIIAATNADILEQVRNREIRKDLYYRLNVVTFHLPRLCERSEDIPLLAEYFLDQYGSRYGRKALRFAPGCLQKMLAYPWPGNIRELEGVIQRGIIMTSSPTLHPDDIELPAPDESKGFGDISLPRAKAHAIEQFERSYLVKILTTHKGNVTHAAKSAGKERRSFQRLLRKYGINRRSFQV